MNTLSDALYDLIWEVINNKDKLEGSSDERIELQEEYVERIKNELNFEKYCQ